MDKMADYCLWSYPWFIGETGIEKECLSAVTEFQNLQLAELAELANFQCFQCFHHSLPFFQWFRWPGFEVRFLAYRKRGSAQEKRIKKLI